jgi:ABC-type glycerol-3-phosphate transport system permease component
LSRFKYLGRDLLGFLILGTQMLPAVAVIVPIVMIVRSLGLTNSIGALAFIHLSLGLPIAVWMLKGYVDSVPVELEEAALIDGCSRVGALYRITFPLIRPAVVAVGTFAFVLSWGEFLMALSLITKVESKTLPLALQTLFDPYSFSWGEVMAGGVVIAAPVVILFLMFRHQIVGGLSAGGVKG